MHRWRWAVVVALVGTLVAAPALAGALPVRDTGTGPAALLAKARASADVGWSGTGESRGALVLPDVPELDTLPTLLGATTRSRAWWRGERDYRVNTEKLTGEDDTIRDARGTWQWDSADRRALRVDGELSVRLPAPVDLLAPVLGRRLAGTTDVTVQPLAARRVAGRATEGVRLVPRTPKTTTVQAVDLWIEPASGLVLQVSVRAGGKPVLESLLLDLDSRTPPPARTAFSRPYDASVASARAPDIAGTIDRFAPFALPETLAGLPRRDRSPLSAGGGAGTYGDGLTAVALLPLPRDLARSVLRRIDPNDDDRRAVISTPLVNGVVAIVGPRRGRGYLIVGTVPAERLDTALEQLAASPPPRNDR